VYRQQPGQRPRPQLTACQRHPLRRDESVRDLYNHCVYNPPSCTATGLRPRQPDRRPWAVLAMPGRAGAQLLALVIAGLILAYGVLQIGLGLAAG